MLSTDRVLKEWEDAVKLLADVKAHTAAHPEQLIVPNSLKTRINSSVKTLSGGMASPAVTWKKLLKKRVSNLSHIHICSASSFC